MNEIEQRLDISRRRVFINALVSTVTDIVVLLLLFKTGTEQGWPTALPVLLVMGLVMALHGRTVLFQLGYVPQYLSDRLNQRTSRDIIREAIFEAGLSYEDVASDIEGQRTEFSYMGAKYMYFFYVDRAYIFPREDVVWVYFTGWRLMTRLFHWEVFYLPHIGLKNGTVHTVMGYVFNREEYEKLAAAKDTLLPRAVFGYSQALSDLYHGAREKFLAILYAPSEDMISLEERRRLLGEVEPPEARVKGSAKGRLFSGIGSLLFLFLVGWVVWRFFLAP